jgi:hypothetical protein
LAKSSKPIDHPLKLNEHWTKPARENNSSTCKAQTKNIYHTQHKGAPILKRRQPLSHRIYIFTDRKW